MAATQEALYADIDLELSWSERDLPQRERTRHVHALHPYLGKFVPQLVEALLGRHFRPGEHVLDPFAGSGTTLVQALESGLDATGVDVAAFNCLLSRVKTAKHDLDGLELALGVAVERLGAAPEMGQLVPISEYLRAWYSPRSLAELLAWRAGRDDSRYAEAHAIVLARAARSARLTAHYDLDFPRAPRRAPYWCFKHRRTCRPVDGAASFLRRYARDTVVRLQAFSEVRHPECAASTIHGDARTVDYEAAFDGIVTSPPYPGLIDYHEQHRYAYELLGLDDRSDLELGAATAGTTRAALERYVEGVAAVLANARGALRDGAPVVIVVNDSRDLYPEILARAALELETRVRRHVNRRTGRRAGEFYEDVLVARAR